MRKRLTSALLAIILAVLFSACSTPKTKGQMEAAAASTQAAGTSSLAALSGAEKPILDGTEEEGNTATKEVVKIMLPASQTTLGTVLTGLAKAQNVNLQVKMGANEPRYTLELAETLLGDDPPDLYWLPSEFAARVLNTADTPPYDLAKNGASAALQALGRMVPEEMRLLDREQVLGLPLGIYAEGTLVNLPLVASLLNCSDLAALQEDLTFCSYEEWKILQTALSDYLVKPGKYQFKLAGNTYTTPGYRPENTKTLRGLWALPTVGEGVYAQNALGVVFASAFVDPADYLDSDPAMTTEFVQDGLKALYTNLEFETLHMVGANGESLARGENWGENGEVTADQAKELFAQGKALFWKGSSQTGMQIEKEQIKLMGNIALIPTKLPFTNQEVATLNSLQATGLAGYLCLRDEKAADSAAGDMLERLYTDPVYIRALEEELQLLPYTDFYPSSPLLASLAEAVSLGDYYQLPLPQTQLIAVQKRMDDWMNINLMGKADWMEEDKAAFLTAVKGMIGAFVEAGSVEGAGSE